MLNVGLFFALIGEATPRPPPIPATKGSATEKFKFLVFEIFFWVFIFLDFLELA
jgi:hypothetical protein